MATYELPVNSLFTETGDDVYAKPLDGNFTGTNWPDDSVAAIEVADTNVYEITLDETKGYVIYLNGHSQSFTADAGSDTITANAHGLLDGEVVRFKGSDLPAGLSQSTLYYVKNKATNTFMVSLTAGGSSVDITDAGSGTMTFTATSKRSKAGDTKIGTVPQVRDVALTAEGEEAIAQAVIDGVDADGFNLNEALRLALAALAGKAAGGNTTTNTFRAADDSKTRITATVNANGERTAITLDAS